MSLLKEKRRDKTTPPKMYFHLQNLNFYKEQAKKKKNSRYLKKEWEKKHKDTKDYKDSVHGETSGFPLWFLLSDVLQFMYL